MLTPSSKLLDLLETSTALCNARLLRNIIVTAYHTTRLLWQLNMLQPEEQCADCDQLVRSRLVGVLKHVWDYAGRGRVLQAFKAS